MDIQTHGLFRSLSPQILLSILLKLYLTLFLTYNIMYIFLNISIFIYFFYIKTRVTLEVDFYKFKVNFSIFDTYVKIATKKVQ